jgi:hypothetical protein
MKKQQTGQPCSKALGVGLGRAPIAREDQAFGSNPDFLTGSTQKERTSMKKHLSKKRVVLAAIIVVALALASGIAYAYWTSTGSGSGAASAADPTLGITVVQANDLTAMYPGDKVQTLHGTLTNNATNNVHVGHVVISGLTVTKKLGAVGDCGASDFTTAGTALVNEDVVGGSSSRIWTGLTIQFNNTAMNQDGCKGASVSINYSTTES